MDLLLKDKNKIINVVDNLKKNKPEGGTNFFDRIDEFVRDPKNVDMVYHLINKMKQEQGQNFNLIVTGKFGDWVFNLIKTGKIQINGVVIHVSGSLRTGIKNKVFQIIGGNEDRVYNNSFVLLDDSYYSGSTKREIEKHLGKYRAKITKTYVFYDGGFEKKSDVYSLYRYYDYHIDDILPIQRLLSVLNNIDETNIPYDIIEGQIMSGQIRSIKELLTEIQKMKRKFQMHGTKVNIKSYGYKREYEGKINKKFKDFLNENKENDEWIYIRVKTSKEMSILLQYLETMNYKWSSGTIPTKSIPSHLTNPCLKIKINEKIIKGTAQEYVDKGDDIIKKGVELESFISGDFKDEYDKKMKELEKRKDEARIKNIEIDPYGEEDWVYEKNIFQPLNTTFDQIYQDIVNNFDLNSLQYLRSMEYPVTYFNYNINGKNLRIEIDREENDSFHIVLDGRYISPRKVSRSIIYKITEFLRKQIPVRYENRNEFNWSESSEKWQKYKEEKRKKEILQHAEIDPYGEEDWVFESIHREFEYTVDQFISRYKKDGRKNIIEFLRFRELEFKTKSKGVEEYKGSIRGILPMISSKNGEKLLFDTRQFGVLEVDDEYPIFIRDIELDESVKWYKNGRFDIDDTEKYNIHENKFEVGDFVIAKSWCIYWGDKGGYGNINEEGEWKNYKPVRAYRISCIDYCDKEGYTGQIIKLDGCWPWFQITNFEKTISEGIKWYSKGKFEQSDIEEVEDEIIDNSGDFKIGDMTIATDDVYFWNDGTYNDRITNVKNDGKWVKYSSSQLGEEGRYNKVFKVDYCNDVDGYTGQIIQISGKWPWFRTTNIKKVINEGIKWYSKGKFGPDEEHEEVFDKIFEIGDRVYGDTFSWYDGTHSKERTTHTNDGQWKPRSFSIGEEPRIDNIEYWENVKRYTGWVVQFSGKWPWFQASNLKKIK